MRRGMLIALVAFLVAVQPALAQQATREQAMNALDEARITIDDMRDAGFGTVLVTDMLKQAESNLERTGLVDYTQIITFTEKIQEIADNAFLQSDSLQAINISIINLEELQVDTSGSRELFALAVDAFENERYDEAELLIDDAFKAVNEEQAEYSRINAALSSTQQSITKFLLDNLTEVLVAAVIIIAVGSVSAVKIRQHRKIRKLQRLITEHEVLTNLIKKAQLDRFEKGDITKREYEIKMEKFKEMLLENEKNISVMKGDKSPLDEK